MRKLKLGLPKGSLQQSTLSLFDKAGFKIYVSERSYFPVCENDEELDLILVRSQEMPIYVEDGIFDLGITGKDWILETKARVKEVSELVYSKVGFKPVRWVLAVPVDSPIKSPQDLNGKIVATELVNVVKEYFKEKRMNVKVQFSWGATEVKAPYLADGIVELIETGASLKANNLRIIDEVLTSTTRLIANKKSWQDPWKRNKIEMIELLLQGALKAAKMVGLKMNLEEKNLAKVMELLPALKKPTVSLLTIPGWLALEVIIEEDKVNKILPLLKKAGAEGIIEYPLNKIIF